MTADRLILLEDSARQAIQIAVLLGDTEWEKPEGYRAFNEIAQILTEALADRPSSRSQLLSCE